MLYQFYMKFTYLYSVGNQFYNKQNNFMSNSEPVLFKCFPLPVLSCNPPEHRVAKGLQQL